MSTIKDLWNRVDAIQRLGPRKHTAAYIARLLKRLDGSDVDEVEARYLRAYLAYHFRCDSTIAIDLESELKAVLESDPRHSAARWYLGCHYFDCRKYDKSLEQFSQVDPAEFTEIASIKLRELMLAARCFTDPLHVPICEVDSLIHDYLEAEPIDTALPSELVRALCNNHLQLRLVWGNETLQGFGRQLRTICDRVAGSDVFSSEISFLEQGSE